MADPQPSRSLASPGAPRLAPKYFRKKLRAFCNRICDLIFFPLWLVFQRLRHGKKIVIICRTGALGDILCALPICAEIRKKHPYALLVFLTNLDYRKMLLLARVADEIYGAKAWVWPFILSQRYKLPGVVEAIYNPQTTDERHPKQGAQTHLIDDLAASCGFTITGSSRQPHLYPSVELIKETQAAFELSSGVAGGHRVIGINCGHTWPVRMWDAPKWQALVDKIHAEFDAEILQFGFTKGADDEYERLQGVRRLVNWMESDKVIALVAGCNLMISIDSGPVHIAGAVDVPVVGLFGAVNPKYRLPPDSPATGVFSDVPCLFCHHATPPGHWKSGCPYDIRCMKELDVETVFAAVKKMLSQSKQ